MFLDKSQPSVPEPRRWRRTMFLDVALFLVLATFLQSLLTVFVTPSPRKLSKPETEEERWSHVQGRLCPRGTPNITFGETLFWMARNMIDGIPLNATSGLQVVDHRLSEITDDDERIHGNDWFDRDTSKQIHRFYNGFFPGMSMYTEEQGGTNVSVLYVKVWKCGSQFLRHWENHVYGFRGKYYPELKVPEAIEILEDRGVENACVVTAIRDPISHFIAGYNEIDFRLHRSEERRAGASEGATFAHLPYQTEEERQIRFTEFVRNILFAPQELHGLDATHVYSMARIRSALAEVGLKMTAYLPSLQNLSSAWPDMLERSCPGLQNLPRNVGPGEIGGKHGSSKDEGGFKRAANDVWSQGGPVAKALCILLAMDYACWDDLPDGIPEVCRDVYQENSFVDIIGSL